MNLNLIHGREDLGLGGQKLFQLQCS
jgi:hypothetical protein